MWFGNREIVIIQALPSKYWQQRSFMKEQDQELKWS